MAVKASQVNELRERINVGPVVAHELLVLAGGDVDMATEASLESRGLDQCRARIIDKRFENIEKQL